MLGAALLKDLRLLARDRAGLVFLTIAPVVVITVAGLSLASLYGADPRGTSAYLLPVADEDGGRIGETVRARLAGESRVLVEEVADREAARDLVRRQVAGAALVIPPGTTAAVGRGEPAALLLYTDPVKYLEVANVRLLVEELRHGIEAAARARAAARLEKERAHATRARVRFERAAQGLKRSLEEVSARLRAARADAERRLAAAEAEATAAAAQARTQLDAALAPLRSFLATLSAREQAFAEWLAAARAAAGRYADRLPPPPAPPEVPPALAGLAADPEGFLRRALPAAALPHVALPPSPALPRLVFPALPALPAAHLPGALRIAEMSVTGAPAQLNTFDQNVPGFSVTFLLLGMLLGVSLGLLDERDWGTLERLRAMPAPFATTLVAKLLARFLVGVVQLAVLFAVGRVAFGISLGPQPWALALPAAGIVFAGTTFGLVVAAVARSRESVLPLGSIVIVTMAAVGGCWWPIDLEPRWMREVALAFPTTWAMAAFNDLMIRRQTVAAAVRPTAVLFGYGLVYLAVGIVAFRQHRSA
jgi:ABC-type multidrug transport system permease subunit